MNILFLLCSLYNIKIRNVKQHKNAGAIFFIKQWTLTKEVGQKYPQKGYNIKTGD